MSHPNWRTSEDYDYVQTLDANGIAWEFIRRSESYKTVYAKLSSPADEPDTSWRIKQQIVKYEPERKPSESDHAWMARADSLGMKVLALTPSMVAARQWGLADMYDPSIQYDRLSIAFARKHGGVDIFVDLPDDKDSHFWSSTPHTTFLGCSPLCELSGTNLDGKLAVAFDLSLPWTHQIDVVKDIFLALQKPDLEKSKTRNRLNKNAQYLRFLDSKVAEPDEDDTVRFSIIVDDEVIRESNQLARVAHKMKNTAEKKAQSYKKG